MKLPSKSLKTNRRECVPHQAASPNSTSPPGRYGDVFEGWHRVDGRKNHPASHLVTGNAAMLGMGEAGEGDLLVPGLGTTAAGLSWHLHVSCLKISIQRGNISVGTSGSIVDIGHPLCLPWHKGVPMKPRHPVPRAGSATACQLAQSARFPLDQRWLQPVSFPGSLGARPSGCSSLCCWALGTASGIRAASSTCASPAGPGEAATSWSPLQNSLLSHPHPPPLTSGSFRMQLNTSALKISGANCLVMKTLITGQLKP